MMSLLVGWRPVAPRHRHARLSTAAVIALWPAAPALLPSCIGAYHAPRHGGTIRHVKAKANLLVVDDDASVRAMLLEYLGGQGYDVRAAADGAAMRQELERELPDLVLLDIMMPVLDGFAVLAQMKADPLLRDIPVIVISAANDFENVVRGIQQGAEDYLPKPFEPTLLHARISASLEKKSLRDQQRKLLHTFASATVAEQLMTNGFSLGGKKIKASIMFADIRSWTTLSEQNDATDTIEMLNSYFAAIFEPIARHGGIVNQIIGDGLMALFGITSKNNAHQQEAVLAALEMMDILKTFNEKQAATGKMQIKIGIGIATGTVIAGYAGTQHRATYTCIGDTVNVASRIQNYTKEAGKPILFDAETRAGLWDSMHVDALGEVMFKGKTVPVQVYSVA
jgi:class 3 adenylate cyclase